ncbi:MAG: choice-of-anchor tandem repeat GloVer-containing protein, partial [Candidatus Cybelea sp.]
SLVNAGGTLYGTTKYGGAYAGGPDAYHPDGGGTVFSITSTGTHKLLYSFGSGTDGSHPYAGLIDVKGTLYGTTRNGGTGACSCGTIFSITTAGTETVLHDFTGSDGAGPVAALLDVAGVLFGTTEYGGPYKRGDCGPGCGVVFALRP